MANIILAKLAERGALSFAAPFIGYVRRFTIVLYAGNVEWQDASKTRCLVMWRSPQEWGRQIFQWVRDITDGRVSTAVLLYEWLLYCGYYGFL